MGSALSEHGAEPRHAGSGIQHLSLVLSCLWPRLAPAGESHGSQPLHPLAASRARGARCFPGARDRARDERERVLGPAGWGGGRLSRAGCRSCPPKCRAERMGEFLPLRRCQELSCLCEPRREEIRAANAAKLDFPGWSHHL